MNRFWFSTHCGWEEKKRTKFQSRRLAMPPVELCFRTYSKRALIALTQLQNHPSSVQLHFHPVEI